MAPSSMRGGVTPLLLLLLAPLLPLASASAVLSGSVGGSWTDPSLFVSIAGTTNVFFADVAIANGGSATLPGAQNGVDCPTAVAGGVCYVQIDAAKEEFGFLKSPVVGVDVDIDVNGLVSIVLLNGATPATLFLISDSFKGLSLGGAPGGSCGLSGGNIQFDPSAGTITITVPANISPSCTLTLELQDPVCFPASATVRRLAAGGAWETVAMPQLRVGDVVQCVAREPAFGTDGAVASAAHRRVVSRCTVYGYKKAAAAAEAAYKRITYEGGDGASATVSMSPNHHLLDPVTGQARQAGGVRPGDLVLSADGPSGALAPAKVLSVDTTGDAGAFVPLLSGGGLPIVDGVVAYPSSGESDVGLDAKHWGQHYLHAPVWQRMAGDAPPAGGATKPGPSLSELGAAQPVAAFTQKWHGVGAAAARKGRTFCDWAGVAIEMHGAVARGKRYTEAEALSVLDRHTKAAPGVSSA